jgi:bacillithiol synthase
MIFNANHLPFLSTATKAFIDKNPDLVNLFESQSSFFSIQKAIEGKKQFPQNSRDVLVEELRNQYKKLNLNIINNQQVVSNIERLLLPNTYTVTTGQQLHPLLGPLYVLYKINDTLQYATLLKEVYPELTFVPIFWLASEDHDFDEVKNVNLFGKTFEWKSEETGAIGRFNPNGVTRLIDEILESVSLNEEQKGLLSNWKTCYAESQTMSEATAKLVHSVFGFDKLIVIDGDSKSLKQQLIPVIKKDVLSSSNYQAFNQFSDKLKEQKFSLQLGAREINFFYLDNQLRSRIVKEGNFYSVLDTELKFSEAELLKLIETETEKFSPNAVLRPLYQETILPNVAYVGGNAEVNYWLQLKGIFDENKTAAPEIRLRTSVWLLNNKQQKLLNSLSFDPIHFFKIKEKQDFLNYLSVSNTVFKELSTEFEGLKEKIQSETRKAGINEMSSLVELGKEYSKLLKKINQLYQNKLSVELEDKLVKINELFEGNFSKESLQERKQFGAEWLLKNPNLIGLLTFKPQLGKHLASIVNI